MGPHDQLWAVLVAWGGVNDAPFALVQTSLVTQSLDEACDAVMSELEKMIGNAVFLVTITAETDLLMQTSWRRNRGVDSKHYGRAEVARDPVYREAIRLIRKSGGQCSVERIDAPTFRHPN